MDPSDDTDGSIFVCFMCEKEFKKVSLLNEHMANHDFLPDKETIKRTRKINAKAKKRKIEKPPVINEDLDLKPVMKDFAPRCVASDRRLSYMPTAKPTPKIKDENLSVQEKADLIARRAMRLKKYISSRENDNKSKSSEDQDESLQESIMMVDTNYFDNVKSSNSLVGPTIMNAEPDGFVCPRPAVPITKETSFMKMKRKFGIGYMALDDEPGFNGIDDVPKGRGHRGPGRPPLSKTGFKMKREVVYPDIKGNQGRRSRPRIDQDEEDSGGFQCLECFKNFRSYSTLNVHMKSHKEAKEIQCPYCDEVFPQRYILYEHLINDHEESSNLTCPICQKIFTRPDTLKSHMVRMHEENGGINCIECGKSFPSQAQLETHVRVHTGERPFKCELCLKTFVQKVHLKTHLRTMHNLTDMPTTPCRICNKMFDGRGNLKDHYTTEHNMSTMQYKNCVANLRKEGKIAAPLPPKVRVVDPSFRYQKVAISDIHSSDYSVIKKEISDSKPLSSPALVNKKGRGRARIKSEPKRAPGMGTVMNPGDDLLMTPQSYDQNPKGRDQEELNIVENAFKVAEEMDQLNENNSTLIVSGEDASPNMYYTLPTRILLDNNSITTTMAASKNNEAGNDVESCQLQPVSVCQDDDEYNEFAAEHADIDVESVDSSGVVMLKDDDSLEIFTAPSDSSSTINMLTM